MPEPEDKVDVADEARTAAGEQPSEAATEDAAAATHSAEEAPAAEPDPRDVALAETKDKLLRALAEMENLRRRSQKERDDTAKYAAAAFAREILPVADNLRRALDAVPDEARTGDETVKGIVEGIELVERDLYDFMLFSLPDNDHHSHKFGPEAQPESIGRADAAFAELADAAGGLDAFLEQNAVILMADHAQTEVTEPLNLAAELAKEIRNEFVLRATGEVVARSADRVLDRREVVEVDRQPGRAGREVGRVGAAGLVLGVLLGGALTTALGWQAVFLVNVPLATVALGLGLILALTIATAACTRVDSYEVAVKKNAVSGAVADEIYSQGLYHAIFRDWTTYPRREIQFPAAGQSERLTALTSDQLTIAIDAAYRYRLVPDSVLDLYLTVGSMNDVDEFVYNTYRSAARDAVEAGVWSIEHGEDPIAVSVWESDDREAVFTRVVSHGPPIPEHVLRTLFDACSHVRQAHRSGLGLGLYIVAQIARAHGAACEVQSSDRETAFTIRWPRAPRAETPGRP